MIVLILFALLAGIVTVLSPCILPVLPVVLSGTVTSGKRRPFGIVTGFILSFTGFTLLTSLLVRATGIDPDSLRVLSIVLITFLGLTLIVPQLQRLSEQLFSSLARLTPKSSTSDGFWGGLLLGLSIGLVWTPCVGPILAAVISLSLTSTVSYAVVLITLAYAIGTAIPMIGIIYAGRSLFHRVPFLLKNLGRIQQVFGVLMILTAAMLFTNTDRAIQQYLLEKFPSWGTGLTKIEDNKLVEDALGKLNLSGDTTKREDGQPAPELVVGGEWLNTEPLTMAQLRGKVVLVDFWTYTCINCIRTLPYLKTWHEKYADKGLVIVGVHAPEFEFEKDVQNVRKAIADFGITYPVMQDNNFATWRNYNNRYWPAKYLIDANGNVRYNHFGEGEYDKTEKMIQTLLKERDASATFGAIENADYQVEARTPETYMGYSRLQYLNIKEQVVTNQMASYTPEEQTPRLNTFDWRGRVVISQEYANPQSAAQLRFHYNAKDVYLVMRGKGTMRVMIDGKPIEASIKGVDVDSEGMVKVDADRLYKLVEGTKGEDHVLMLEFVDNTIELFAFTFG